MGTLRSADAAALERWPVTFGGIHPIVLGLLLAPRPLTRGWPVPVGMLPIMGLTIALMTWVVMPRLKLTAQLGPWLRR